MNVQSLRLVLGTVQLGQNYGIANCTGMPVPSTAIQIIRTAWDGGIRTFDTAHAYGASQEVLGRAIAESGIEDEARIVSKFPVNQPLDSQAIRKAVNDALAVLEIPCLEAMLFHRDNVIESWGQVCDTLEGMREDGLIRHYGISSYDPEHALAALDCRGLDAVQVPGNLLDRRFDSAGFMAEAIEHDVTVYLRSVFLQGLLLMNPDTLPAKVEFANDVVGKVAQVAEQYGLDRDETGFVLCT